jgi:hypothetical protein
MKRHRFDPFSFLFGAVFLTLGCSFLFGASGATAVRPFRAWPAAVVAVGLVLVAWAVARVLRPESGGPHVSSPPTGDAVSAEPSSELFNGETHTALRNGEPPSEDVSEDRPDERRP